MTTDNLDKWLGLTAELVADAADIEGAVIAAVGERIRARGGIPFPAVRQGLMMALVRSHFAAGQDLNAAVRFIRDSALAFEAAEVEVEGEAN